MYRVLYTQPACEKTGESAQTSKGPVEWQKVVRWVVLGYAESMEEAKEKYGCGLQYGRAPVLEPIRGSDTVH